MCKAAKSKITEELHSVAQEIAFAKGLAANDKSLRDRALKKLRKWLSFKSAEESSGIRFTEDGLMRIWKGLFYCVWMSDKPLVQEEVVESVTSLIHCFTRLEDAQQFVSCFFQSMTHSWFTLDSHRIDKFLMLIRRFVRQIFEYLYKQEWNEEYVESIAGILNSSLLTAPVGLNLHLSEVYIEELAKVGRGELKPNTVLQIIKPFGDYMAQTIDTRVLKYIMDFIFLQLIRQSDEGIKYGAKFEVWREMGFPEGDIDVIKERSDDELEADDEDMEMDEDEPSCSGTNVLDPRAGNVDVLLPPIDFDPILFRDYLKNLLRLKNTTSKARKTINFLIKKFDTFIEGKYPLGIHKFEVPEIEDEEELVDKSVQKLLDDEKSISLAKKNKKGRISLDESVSQNTWEVTELDDSVLESPKGVSTCGKWEVTNLKKRKCPTEESLIATMKRIKLPDAKKSPCSAKKVEFVLNRNKSQGEQEYKLSLKKNPLIPFDADKKPRQGVLKSSTIGSPMNPFYCMEMN